MITIPRFEITKVERGTNIRIDKKTTIAIKDHATDTQTVILNLEDDVEKNKRLAALLIETIEEFIENNGNEN